MAEIVWKGGWSSTDNLSDITYYVNDVVSHENITYIATAEVAIGSPVPPLDMANWNTFVSGALGTSGTSGESGTSGTSGVGLPTGGTSGQMLVKNSSTSGDASWVSFDEPTYVQASLAGGQTFAVGNTVITSWSNNLTNNAGEWNATTGVFTATKAGTYSVTCFLQLNSIEWNAGIEVGLWFTKNGSISSVTRWFPNITATYTPPTITNTVITKLEIGNTISFTVFHNNSTNPQTLANGTYLTIQEVPSKIRR